MKDKLEKHGKKPSYFFLRKALVAFLGFIVLISAIALPVTIYIVTVFTFA